MINERPVVRFNFLHPFSLRERKLLRLAVVDLFNTEERNLGSLDYIFCDDEYLLKINQDYLHHDTLTDIITFDLSDQQEPIVGEIYISIDRVKENAQGFNVDFATELRRVVFHGALHLCGYKDKKKTDRSTMTSKENFYLEKYKVSRGKS